jgi:hypothetical protein
MAAGAPRTKRVPRRSTTPARRTTSVLPRFAAVVHHMERALRRSRRSARAGTAAAHGQVRHPPADTVSHRMDRAPSGGYDARYGIDRPSCGAERAWHGLDRPSCGAARAWHRMDRASYGEDRAWHRMDRASYGEDRAPSPIRRSVQGIRPGLRTTQWPCSRYALARCAAPRAQPLTRRGIRAR